MLIWLLGCPQPRPPALGLAAGGGHVFALRSGQLYERLDTDLTSAWTPITTPAPVFAVAVAPSGAWWSLGGDHLFFSTDNGGSWAQIPDAPVLVPVEGWPGGPPWHSVTVAGDGTVIVSGRGLVAWQNGAWSSLLAEPVGEAVVSGQDYLVSGHPWRLWCGTLPAPPTPCEAGLPVEPATTTSTALAIGLRGDGAWLVGAWRGVFTGWPGPWTLVAPSPRPLSSILLDVPHVIGPGPDPGGLTVQWADQQSEWIDAAGHATPLHAWAQDLLRAGPYVWTGGGAGGQWVEALDAAGNRVVVPIP